jgi:hypothetical protein
VSSSWAYAIWAALATAALLLCGLSYVSAKERVAARPSAVLARLAGDRWLRLPLLVGWAWVGWHLFAR